MCLFRQYNSYELSVFKIGWNPLSCKRFKSLGRKDFKGNCAEFKNTGQSSNTFPESKKSKIKQRVILLTPQGKKFEQKDAHRLAKYDQLIFVCGRYEGFDERIRKFVDEEMSIGDYILMGGELPALVISEAVIRLRKGILGKIESTDKESFSENMLEYPQYTKPEVMRVKVSGARVKSMRVPKVLLSGNHQKVNEWRMQEAIKRTKKRRPDILKLNKIDHN